MSEINHQFLRQYLASALWSSEADGEFLDSDYDLESLSPQAMEQAKEDSALFLDLAKEYIGQFDITIGQFDITDVAHDFWLTRNGDGAGFWDGDYPEPQATLLTEISKLFDPITLYVGDDNQLYFK